VASWMPSRAPRGSTAPLLVGTRLPLQLNQGVRGAPITRQMVSRVHDQWSDDTRGNAILSDVIACASAIDCVVSGNYEGNVTAQQQIRPGPSSSMK